MTPVFNKHKSEKYYCERYLISFKTKVSLEKHLEY